MALVETSGPGERAVGVVGVRSTSSSGAHPDRTHRVPGDPQAGQAQGGSGDPLEVEERLLRDVTDAAYRVRSPRHRAGVGALMRALRVAREAGLPELRIRVASARGRDQGHQDEVEDLVEDARAQELAGYPEGWI